MPILTGNCGAEKPIVNVGVLPALPRPDEVGQSSVGSELHMVQCRALLDTGADGTSISSLLARSSGLRSYGKQLVVGINGQNYHRTWGMYLAFFVPNEQGAPSPHLFPDPLLAIEIPDNQWFEIIIGRDILQQCNFSLKRGGTFELEIPDY
jgi:hypothetical protein